MMKVTWYFVFFVVTIIPGSWSALPIGYPYDYVRDIYHDTNLYHSNLNTYFGSEDEQTSEYWLLQAQDSLKAKLGERPNTNIAKNVILFLGDGMSIPTLAAARVYLGQLSGLEGGEKLKLAFEEFPYSGLSKTYCVNSQVADSACSATAYLTGVKGNIGTLGVNAQVKYKDCQSAQDPTRLTKSIATCSQVAGKHTGLVTTTRVTHASPAGVYAHSASRNWECDADVSYDDADPALCLDIARQLLNGTGAQLNVILGGGRQKFLPTNVNDEDGAPGQRADNANLIEEWKQSKGSSGQYVSNRGELLKVKTPKYLLGLFANDHLDYHIKNITTQPTLTEMTETAIRLLSNSDSGYFLFVEGGRIDHGHHGTKAVKALDETVEFHKAIARTLELINLEDTLVLVTADHAHTMSLSGYASRGNNIFGQAGKGSDKLPYSTLSYANGPAGFKTDKNGKRHDISKDNMENSNYKYPSLVPLSSETHGGDDVGIYTIGPWAHLFTGVIEQNVIPHILAYASCVGPGVKACDNLACPESERESEDLHDHTHGRHGDKGRIHTEHVKISHSGK